MLAGMFIYAKQYDLNNFFEIEQLVKRAPRPGCLLNVIEMFLEIPECTRPKHEVNQLLEDWSEDLTGTGVAP